MNTQLSTLEKYCLAFCLPLGIIDISRGDWWPSIACLALAIAIAIHNSLFRLAAIQIGSFLIAYTAYRFAALFISLSIGQSAFNILADRMALLVIIIIMAIQASLAKLKAVGYIDWPEWSGTISFPIWKNRRKTENFGRFFLVALIITIAVFTTLALTIQDPAKIKLPFFAFTFALANAVLEEVIWRGQLLYGLSKSMGTPLAVAISSAGFGFQHLALGFSLPVSLAMAIGGVGFAFFTLKSKSLIPAIILHAVANLGMVACGLILTQ